MLSVWGRRNSFNVQKVMWLVGELALAHRHEPAGGQFGRVGEPEFLAMNPHGRVPVIDDGGTISLADIAAGTHLYRYFELDIARPDIPHVQTWYERLKARPAYRTHARTHARTQMMILFDDLRGRLDYQRTRQVGLAERCEHNSPGCRPAHPPAARASRHCRSDRHGPLHRVRGVLSVCRPVASRTLARDVMDGRGRDPEYHVGDQRDPAADLDEPRENRSESVQIDAVQHESEHAPHDERWPERQAANRFRQHGRIGQRQRGMHQRRNPYDDRIEAAGRAEGTATHRDGGRQARIAQQVVHGVVADDPPQQQFGDGRADRRAERCPQNRNRTGWLQLPFTVAVGGA